MCNNLERTEAHGSNVAGCVIDVVHENRNLHQISHVFRNDSEDFHERYEEYIHKYALCGKE